MNESINLPKLINLIASATECTPTMARRFLHEFFALIESTLSHGESVTIKGVGEFVRTDNSANPVKFLADKELAEVANEPFSAFEAVELNDGVTEEELAAVDNIELSSSQISDSNTNSVVSVDSGEIIEPIAEQIQEESPVEVSTPVGVSESEQVSETTITDSLPENPPVYKENSQDVKSEEAPISKEENEYNPESDSTSEYSAITPSGSNNNVLWLLLGFLIGLILGLVGGYFAGKQMSQFNGTDEIYAEVDSLRSYISEFSVGPDSINHINSEYVQESPKQDSVVISSQQVVSESAMTTTQNAVQTQPSEQYDYVTKQAFLTTLAGKHYGNKNYWVFIYQANPQLKHPDRIAPGTKVLIPARSTFEGATKAETDAKARRLLAEINRKYR